MKESTNQSINQSINQWANETIIIDQLKHDGVPEEKMRKTLMIFATTKVKAYQYNGDKQTDKLTH